MAKFLLQDNKGQGLIEALVALGAAVIIISTIAIAVVTAVNNSDFSKNQNLAKTYAEQGLESIRTQARQNWASFYTLPLGSYCLPEGRVEISGNPETSGCNVNVNNFFVRTITLSSLGCSAQGRKALVEVAWTDGKCSATDDYCHEALLETCLENINSVPTP
jgi:Tfp pilus assembly protein PilV